MKADIVYSKMENLYAKLTLEEKNVPYRNSASKFANRVQFARLHLVNKGLLYDAKQNTRGYWKLTPKGALTTRV